MSLPDHQVAAPLKSDAMPEPKSMDSSSLCKADKPTEKDERLTERIKTLPEELRLEIRTHIPEARRHAANRHNERLGLFRLPLEVRLWIFELVVHHQCSSVSWVTWRERGEGKALPDEFRLPSGGNMLAVCQQMSIDLQGANFLTPGKWRGWYGFNGQKKIEALESDGEIWRVLAPMESWGLGRVRRWGLSQRSVAMWKRRMQAFQRRSREEGLIDGVVVRRYGIVWDDEVAGVEMALPFVSGGGVNDGPDLRSWGG